MIRLRHLLVPLVILVSLICYGQAFADAAEPAGLAHGWDVFMHALTYPLSVGSLPIGPLWSVLLLGLVLPLLNEALQRWKGTRAQSFLQFLSNVVVIIRKSPFGKIPIVTQILAILTVFKTPEPVALDGAEVVTPRANKAAGRAPLVVVLALALVGCAGAAAWTKCELGHLPQTVQSLVAAVAAIAGQPSGYLEDLQQLGTEVGPDQVDCIALAISADAAPPKAAGARPQPAWTATVRNHLAEYLSTRRAAGAKLACEPHLLELLEQLRVNHRLQASLGAVGR